MKTGLCRPLIKHLKREIEQGDINRALRWASEYQEDDPYCVKALFILAERSGRLSSVELSSLNGHCDNGAGSSLSSLPMNLKSPSHARLASRFNIRILKKMAVLKF
jgi:hypothetical protein